MDGNVLMILEINLAPLTSDYRDTAWGKSTVIQSMPLLRQVLMKRYYLPEEEAPLTGNFSKSDFNGS